MFLLCSYNLPNVILFFNIFTLQLYSVNKTRFCFLCFSFMYWRRLSCWNCLYKWQWKQPWILLYVFFATFNWMLGCVKLLWFCLLLYALLLFKLPWIFSQGNLIEWNRRRSRDCSIVGPDSRPNQRFGQDLASRLNNFNNFLELLLVVITLCYPVIFNFRCVMFLRLKYIIWAFKKYDYNKVFESISYK